MTDKIIVIFVEGQTEIKFYKHICKQIQKDNKTQIKLIVKNLKGVGNYGKKAFSIIKNDILPKNKKANIIVFCAYDTDVFEFQSKPAIDWQKVKKDIRSLKIEDIYEIKVIRSIEDWFLLDLEGLCRYLRLKNVPKSIKGKSGYDKMKILFKQKQRIYQKGTSTSDFVEKLDYVKLLKLLEQEFKEFVEACKAD